MMTTYRPAQRLLYIGRMERYFLGSLSWSFTTLKTITRDKVTICTCTDHWLGHSWNTASRYGIHTLNRTWKTGTSTKKSHTNDSELQGFELRGEKVWTNNTGESRHRGDLIEAYKVLKRNQNSGRG